MSSNIPCAVFFLNGLPAVSLLLQLFDTSCLLLLQAQCCKPHMLVCILMVICNALSNGSDE
jgi:hypothetical protein